MASGAEPFLQTPEAHMTFAQLVCDLFRRGDKARNVIPCYKLSVPLEHALKNSLRALYVHAYLLLVVIDG